MPCCAPAIRLPCRPCSRCWLNAPLPLAWQTEEILYRLAGEQNPTASLGSGKEEERRKCRAAWETWWKANEAKIDIAKIRNEEPLRGLTVVTEFDGEQGGRVWEFGPDGKMRWQIKNLSGPNDVQMLPGGRVLIAERNGNRVTERDREGKILWEYASTNNSPIAAQRLPNGNTLIATFNQLLEVSPDKRTVQTHTNPSGFRHALRLRNGHILYIASNGQVVELDAQFKEVRTITPEMHGGGASYWASVEPLPNGRFLLALGTSGKVIEIDGTGKIQWQCDVPNVVFATRLAQRQHDGEQFRGPRAHRIRPQLQGSASHHAGWPAVRVQTVLNGFRFGTPYLLATAKTSARRRVAKYSRHQRLAVSPFFVERYHVYFAASALVESSRRRHAVADSPCPFRSATLPPVVRSVGGECRTAAACGPVRTSDVGSCRRTIVGKCDAGTLRQCSRQVALHGYDSGLRDPGRVGPRRHGRRLQGAAPQTEARRGVEDDPGGQPRRCGGPGTLPDGGGGDRALAAPNIVQVYEVGEHEGKPFFSLEFCGGGSLEKKLNGTPLPAREAAALVETLARAMQAAHEQQSSIAT